MCASLVAGAAGCTNNNNGDDKPDDPVVATRPSRSSAIALSEDEARVAMVNPDDGSLSVFQTSDNSRLSKTATGGNPSSVVIAPDGKTAYVANRADGTVVRLSGIDGSTPSVSATVTVGAEPAGLALSPSGKQLFVAEYSESRVSVIDTGTMRLGSSIAIDRPRALLVTNNGDSNDADEQLVVAQYFGVPVTGGEAKDDGRTGRIQTFSLGLKSAGDITLSPINSGFARFGGSGTVNTSPNQLGAMAVDARGRLYVTSVSASPEGPGALR